MDIIKKSLNLGKSFKTLIFDSALKQNVQVDVVLKEDYDLVKHEAMDDARRMAAKALEEIVFFEEEEESDKMDMILDFLQAFDKMREDESDATNKQRNTTDI